MCVWSEVRMGGGGWGTSGFLTVSLSDFGTGIPVLNKRSSSHLFQKNVLKY